MFPILLLMAEYTYPWPTKPVMKKMLLLIIIIHDYPDMQPEL